MDHRLSGSLCWLNKKPGIKYPQDPGSPKLRMVMEPSTLGFGGDYTPYSSFDKVIGSLGYFLFTKIPLIMQQYTCVAHPIENAAFV